MTPDQVRVDKALQSLSNARTSLDDPAGLSEDDHRWWEEGGHNEYTIAMIDDAMRLLSPEKRTVLVHLNVQVPMHDERTPEEIAAAIHGAIDVGSDDDEVRHLVVTIPLVEEVL